MNYNIIIIGAGAAGMTAAIYATRAGKSVLVLESTAPGGQILETHHIENYPAFSSISGPELAKNIETQAKSLGAVFKTETAVKIRHPEPAAVSEKTIGGEHLSLTIAKTSDAPLPRWEVITDMKNSYTANAVILATGTTYRHLNLPGEDELVGHGISYCATCDGTLYKDQIVAVYGGGNSALYSALYLADLAEKVYLIHRRNEFRADASLVEKAKAKTNIEFVLDTTISELISADTLPEPTPASAPSESISTDIPSKPISAGAPQLSAVKLKNGRTLDVTALFVTIGREANLGPLADSDDLAVDLDEDGYIVTGATGETSEPGIFAAGDCISKPLRQIVTAVSDGALAATSAVKNL